MRLDYVTIFPDYFAPLELSLAGQGARARAARLHVHDLRHWTHDRHRTVDDTPYGGGAGMVMKPEPWGEALDELLGPTAPRSSCPTPSGTPFTQARRPRAGRAGAAGLRLRALRGHRPAGARPRRGPGRGARDLARRLRAQRGRGRRAGDHRGGRAAAARLHGQRRVAGRGVARGRPARVPRLHQAGLLARPATCPTCCSPATTPRIAAWRRAEARTPYRRAPPRPAPAERGAGRPGELRRGDAGRRRRALTLQRACWVQEMHDNPGVEIPALHESFDDLGPGCPSGRCWCVRRDGSLVGAVARPAARATPGTSAG